MKKILIVLLLTWVIVASGCVGSQSSKPQGKLSQSDINILNVKYDAGQTTPEYSVTEQEWWKYFCDICNFDEGYHPVRKTKTVGHARGCLYIIDVSYNLVKDADKCQVYVDGKADSSSYSPNIGVNKAGSGGSDIRYNHQVSICCDGVCSQSKLLSAKC